MKEAPVTSLPGIPTLLGLIVAVPASAYIAFNGLAAGNPVQLILAIVLAAVLIVCLGGFYMVEPNQAAVLSLFGKYIGTCKDQGLRWNNPFFATRKVSLRTRNFESSKLKVNDLDGNPIEIASVVVWQVVDSAEAVYNVDDYESFVHIQTESAVRAMEIQERLALAGVQIMEARISHLAYSPEIAQAMLQRQQAGAIIAARTRIVEGAVSMVEMALNELSKRNVVDLDPERRAAMVSNLLVVLCGERGTQPIVNTGSIY
jgi:hypothetical protein